MSSALLLHRGSTGLDAGALRPGQDLVLDPLPPHGLALADGTTVDDLIDADARAEAERRAAVAQQAWHTRRSAALTLDGVDLAHAWEVELLAEVFLPMARLELALAAAGAADVIAKGFEPAFVAALAEAAGAHGISVKAQAGSSGGAPAIHKAALPLPARALGWAGVPARVRAPAVGSPYWHLTAVYAQLAASGGIAAANAAIPGLSPRTTAAVALRGGWLGYPGARARARSRTEVEAALDVTPHDGLDALALSVLRRRALESLAIARHARRGLERGRARLLVLPFDSPEAMRMLQAGAALAGVPTLVVQHGFDARLNDPDKRSADHLALWSERDARELRDVARARTIEVTGNPGAAHLTGAPPARGNSDRVVVLVEYPSRLSAQLDARINLRHTDTALAGLAAARPGATAVLRPHPADAYPESYAELGARHPELRVELDTTTPIEPLLRDCGLLIGAISTATLQAAALGVPTVFLDTTTAPRPWPFDGSADAFPRVTDADSLAAVVSSPPAPGTGADAAREALGAHSDAVDRVCALINRLARTGA